MSMYNILYYSPTGNTAYLAKRLSKLLKTDSIQAIEDLDYKKIKPSRHLIVMYAIHAFNAPKQVREFVKGLPEGLAEKVSIIAVGCNLSWINDGATMDVRRLLIRKGYDISVEKVIAMPLTLVMSFPEELIKEQIKVADIALKNIETDILECKKCGLSPSFKTMLLRSVGKIEPAAARIFGLELHAKKSCIQCGICVKGCPTKNIRHGKKGKIRFGFKCSMCLRCIYNCPTKSITPYVSKFIPIKNGYSINSYVGDGEAYDDLK